MNGQQLEQRGAPFGNATCEQGHCVPFPAPHSTSGQGKRPPHGWESPAQGQERLCLSCGRVLPLLWEGFASPELLKTSFRNVDASLQSTVEKQSSKSQPGKPSGAEGDELGRLEPHPALQIPEGEPEGKTCSSLRALQVLTWPMKPHQTPKIMD